MFYLYLVGQLADANIVLFGERACVARLFLHGQHVVRFCEAVFAITFKIALGEKELLFMHVPFKC